jgi:microcystin-dependent protein
VGTIAAWPAISPPAGWLLCDGSAQSRATYAALFAVTGTDYGIGDGSTTFNLPDLRGRMCLGTGAGAGLTARTLAATGGEETHVLALAELTAHTHAGIDHTHGIAAGQFNHAHTQSAHATAGNHSQDGHTHTYPAIYNAGPVTVVGGAGPTVYANASTYTTSAASANAVYGANYWSDNNTLPAGVTGAADRSLTTGATGSGAAHNTMPPFVVITFIIRASYQVPQTGPSVPLADTTQAGLINKVSGLTTDFIDGTNNLQDFPSAVRAAVVLVRSFNSIGNPNFEVDARTVGAGTASSGQFACDRWHLAQTGALGTVARVAATSGIVIPGTNFGITSSFLRFTLTTPKATLAAADYTTIYQTIEGSRLRELFNDVHSLKVLVRCSAALKFGVVLRTTASPARCLGKIATITNPNAWTTLELPALPIWAADGTWYNYQGQYGYDLLITLACGSTYLTPANDTWQATGASGVIGALGQDNFGAQPANATFDLACVQHEPGGSCSQFIDLNFEDNHRACKRYFAKSNQYATITPTANAWSVIGQAVAGTTLRSSIEFPEEMAKAPTMSLYGADASANYVYLDGVGEVAITTPTATTRNVQAIVTTAAYAAAGNGQPVLGMWKADTGW